MGFSVTAASAIFFIAALTAASAAMDAYFDARRVDVTARRSWETASASQVDTNLTLSVALCSNGCKSPKANTFQIDVRNSGTTVLDYRNITLVIDGTAHTVANYTSRSIVSPSTVTGTDLILPGETMRIDMQDVPLTATYSTSTVPVQAATLDGVIGRR